MERGHACVRVCVCVCVCVCLLACACARARARAVCVAAESSDAAAITGRTLPGRLEPTIAPNPASAAPASWSTSGADRAAKNARLRAAAARPWKRSTAQRKCCCPPMTDPGRMRRSQPMASRAAKP